LFFNPDTTQVIYHGAYRALDGQSVSGAYASALHISFDVSGGLLARQVHHWAALVFVAAITLHLLRIVFTGAFRKPRTSTISSASLCWRSRSWRGSPATRCPTTCSREWGWDRLGGRDVAPLDRGSPR